MSAQPDVIVIGAGLIGYSVAHALSRQGADVLVLDAGKPGTGASQASAGMLCPHIEGAHDPLLQQLGSDSLARYDTFIDRVRGDSGMDVPYVRHGSLQVAHTEQGVDDLLGLADVLHRQGIPCQLAEGEAAVHELEPLLRQERAGLLIESHGAVRIRDLLHALQHGCSNQGVRSRHSARVARVARADDHIVVHTDAHTFNATHVVVTAGAWATHLHIEGHAALPTHPVRGQLLRLQMREGALRRVLWGPGVYMVPWGDEVLVGATEEHVGFDSRATVAGVMQLCTAAHALVPALSDASFTEVRVGLRPGSPDGLPFIGASRRMPGLVYATGHFRNGALLTPLTADLVADIVRDGSAAVPPALAASRFDL